MEIAVNHFSKPKTLLFKIVFFHSDNCYAHTKQEEKEVALFIFVTYHYFIALISMTLCENVAIVLHTQTYINVKQKF